MKDMDDSEVDVDMEEEDIAWMQLEEERPIQRTLEPYYEQGEEKESEIEQEAKENGAQVGYTVYYQNEEERQIW